MYLGPYFFISYQYGLIIALNGIALLFGAIMPSIFFICLFGLILIYISDRFLIAYSYRAPPVYDRKLITITLYILKFSIVGYILMGCWIYSNQ